MADNDPIVQSGGDAGRFESEVQEIVFNPEVSDLEYFLSRKRHFEREGKLPPPDSIFSEPQVL